MRSFPSCTSRRLHKAATGLWFFTNAKTCSCVPPVATLLTTHAASFFTSHSPTAN